jgi:hypothetical protein
VFCLVSSRVVTWGHIVCLILYIWRRKYKLLSKRSAFNFGEWQISRPFWLKDGEVCVLGYIYIYIYLFIYLCRLKWPRGLWRRSTAAHLLRSWVRIPPRAWIFFCCVCWVLSGRDLCDELVTRPRGVPPNVARRMWSSNLLWWGGHSPRWAAEPEKIIIVIIITIIITIINSAIELLIW